MFGYADKAPDGSYVNLRFGEKTFESDVEISEDVFLLPKEVAQATKEGLLPPTLTTTKQAPPKTERREGPITAILPLPIVGKLTWEGAVPPQKWMTFYTKVLSRFPIGEGLKLTVKVEIQPKDGIPKQKVDETKTTQRTGII